MNTLTLNVNGMMCGGCEKTVQTALNQLDNVTYVKADHTNNRVEISYTGDPPTNDVIKQAITDAGYTLAE